MATNRRVIDVEEKVPLLQGIPLSLQHLFAMFGASILVPILFNGAAGKQVIDPSLVLFMNGVGTLIYLFICRGKAPAFLGSSFAFLSPTFSLLASKTVDPSTSFARAAGGFVIAGLVFAAVSLVIRFAGRRWISVVLPPAAMGPIVALIGLELAPVATKMAFYTQSGELSGQATLISLFTLGVVILGSMVFRGFLSAIPVLIGVLAGYVLSIFLGAVTFDPVAQASFFTHPTPVWPEFDGASILVVLPAALVVISEHIGHLFVTSNIVGRNLLKNPGLHNSLLGDGVSTMLSGFTGSCPTTTYGENMGVMAITKVYSVWVIGGAAVISIALAFFGQVRGAIATLPVPVIGGISMMLFGVIAASGLRMLIEARVDYSKSRNLMLSAVVFVVGIAPNVAIPVGQTKLSGMVLATLVGMVLSLCMYALEQTGLTNEPPEPLTDGLDAAHEASASSSGAAPEV